MTPELVELSPGFVATRQALHSVAENVAAAARFQAEQRIGLRVWPGGFGTPSFADDEIVRVDGIELVHERRGRAQRAAITTLAAAADFVGVPLGAPPVYTAVTTHDAEAALEVDANAACALAAWFAFCDARLEELVRAVSGAAAVTLWPEHFDVATSFADANFGGSAGDDAIAEPYLYAGPWAAERRTGIFAAYPWGAAITYAELRAAGDPESGGRAFFQRAVAELSQ